MVLNTYHTRIEVDSKDGSVVVDEGVVDGSVVIDAANHESVAVYAAMMVDNDPTRGSCNAGELRTLNSWNRIHTRYLLHEQVALLKALVPCCSSGVHM